MVHMAEKMDQDMKTYVDAETKRRVLKVLETRPKGTKITDVLREAIEEWLERHEPKPKQ